MSPAPEPVPSPIDPPPLEVKAGVFKDTCLQLLDRVHDEGIEVVVTKRGVPVARVVPPGPPQRAPFGALRGTVLAQEDLVAPDHEAWAEGA